MSKVRSDLNGGKLRPNKIEFFIENGRNRKLNAVADGSKVSGNKDFLLCTQSDHPKSARAHKFKVHF